VRLEKKVAIVTGAAQGMGLAIARLFAQHGASVAMIDVNEAGLSQAATTMPGMGPAPLRFTADISDASAVAQTVRRIDEAWGRVDVLVNNAAVQSPGGTFVDATEADWQRFLSINVVGAGFLIKEVVPLMIRQGGGSIVNISSISGLVVFPGQAVYATTKGAVLQLTRAAAVDFGKHSIRVNAICPGPTQSGPLVQATEAQIQALAQQHPLQRIAQPEDIAYAALFLASDESRHITGVALPVDGGFTAR
jgi:NAD(P)-dependent dehydrogenase (short-subunit alcohol dehydrogenase family)